MEVRSQQKMWMVMVMVMVMVILSLTGKISSLSVTVNKLECVFEYVLYEGDTVSRNFVVIDHDIFWSSDHPGIDFTVVHKYHLKVQYSFGGRDISSSKASTVTPVTISPVLQFTSNKTSTISHHQQNPNPNTTGLNPKLHTNYISSEASSRWPPIATTTVPEFNITGSSILALMGLRF